MLAKRIIPCLDVRNGRVVKGTNFEGLRDMADPVEMARFYNASGADELVFYDITASFEQRRLFTDILREVVDSFPRCSFDRACMLGFGTANYRFQLLYVVRQSGIREFQLTRSAVNLAIQERLNAGHIPSAYPTTHVLLTETPQGAGPAAGAAPAPAADPGAGAASPPPGA